jgi:hypothetical protein
VVKGVVTKVDDGKKEVSVQLGKEMASLPLKEMKWARKPNKEVPYYAARVKTPSSVLKPGDVVLVRILEKYGDGAAKKGEDKEKRGFAWRVALEQTPKAQGALVCLDARTGEVKTMLGGRSFDASQFNRAMQSRRQPGSAFKPLIYSAALDRGMTPVTIIMDSPYVSAPNAAGEVWKPKNYKEKFYGPTLIRTGLAKSRNVITVKILNKIGIKYAIDYARNMGIESDLTPNLSLALGSSGVSLMELTRAYAAFANGGMLVKPFFIKRVLDRGGNIIEENQPDTAPVISRETAFVMTDLLKAVVTEGTGWRIRALKRPVAGKTGTTNDLRDAWFMGYTPGLVTGVWVGYDDSGRWVKGETGSRAASPIWLDFMQHVLAEEPVRTSRHPKGLSLPRSMEKPVIWPADIPRKPFFRPLKRERNRTLFPKAVHGQSENLSHSLIWKFNRNFLSHERRAEISFGPVGQDRRDISRCPLGHLSGAPNVGPRGDSHQQPKVSAQFPGRGDGVFVRHFDHFVHQGFVQYIGNEPVADALNLVKTGFMSQKGGHVFRFHRGDSDAWPVLFQEFPDTLQGAAASHPGHEAVDVAVYLLPQLTGGFFVVYPGVIGIFKLLQYHHIGFRCRHLPHPLNGPFDILFRRGQYQVSAQRTDQLFSFFAHVFRHDDADPVSFEPTHQRNADARVSGSGFRDDGIGGETARFLRAFNHGHGHPVLDAAARVQEFRFAENAFVFQLNEGRISHKL